MTNEELNRYETNYNPAVQAAQRRLIAALEKAHQAGEEAIRIHDQEADDGCCDCCLCEEFWGTLYNLRVAISSVECETVLAHPTPEEVKELLAVESKPAATVPPEPAPEPVRPIRFREWL